MRKNEIRPGVIYASQASKYSPPEPIVFLVAPAEGVLHKTASVYKKPHEPAYLRALSDTKPYRSCRSNSRCGYAAVRLGSVRYDRETGPDALLKPSLADFEGCTSAYAPEGFKGFRFDLVTSLSHITGLYEDVNASYEAERDAEHEQSRRLNAEREAAQKRAADIASGLTRLGVDAFPPRPGDPHDHVRIPLEAARDLLVFLEAAGYAR